MLVLLFLYQWTEQVFADCCNPGLQWSVGGIVTYAFGNADLMWSDGQKNEFNNVASAWSNVFAASHSDVRVIEAQSTTPQWGVVWSDSVAPWAFTDANSHTIFIHTSVLQQPYSFMQFIFSHELGHIMGYGHGNCQPGQSVMAVSQPTDNYSTYPGGCEQQYTTNYYADACANGGCTPGYTHDTSLCASGDPGDQCGCCLNETPLLVDLGGDGFRMSGLDEGVTFDVNGLHHVYKLGWPLAHDDAWLARDVNGDGIISTGAELFGSATRLANGGVARDGFAALSDLDSNHDQWIDRQDAAYHELVLWRDLNRNGRSDPGELLTPDEAGVLRISLGYRESRRRDEWGNRFRYRSEVLFSDQPMRRAIVDVFPVWEKIDAPACSVTSNNRQSAGELKGGR